MNIWDPTSSRAHQQRRQKRSVRTSYLQLDVSGLRNPQLARTLATLDLSGMIWSDATQKLFHQSKKALGLQRHKAAYWAYDFKEEVEEIVAERKAAGNPLEALWWPSESLKRAERVERAAEMGDSRLQYQLLREICGSTRRRPISLLYRGQTGSPRQLKKPHKLSTSTLRMCSTRTDRLIVTLSMTNWRSSQ